MSWPTVQNGVAVGLAFLVSLGSTPLATAHGFLFKEDGGFILQEDNSAILLE